MSLTSACCVHSNVDGLGNICWIRYLTVVDPLHSISSAVHTYRHINSGSVEIRLVTSTENSRFIGKKTVSWGRSIRSATSTEISYTEQGIIPFTNVLQGHTTVVLVCCTIEWEPDITCTWKYKCHNAICIQTCSVHIQCLSGDICYTLVNDTRLKSETFLLSYFYSHPQSFNSHVGPLLVQSLTH